jgi:hypothetical protein
MPGNEEDIAELPKTPEITIPQNSAELLLALSDEKSDLLQNHSISPEARHATLNCLWASINPNIPVSATYGHGTEFGSSNTSRGEEGLTSSTHYRHNVSVSLQIGTSSKGLGPRISIGKTLISSSQAFPEELQESAVYKFTDKVDQYLQEKQEDSPFAKTLPRFVRPEHRNDLLIDFLQTQLGTLDTEKDTADIQLIRSTIDKLKLPPEENKKQLEKFNELSSTTENSENPILSRLKNESEFYGKNIVAQIRSIRDLAEGNDNYDYKSFLAPELAEELDLEPLLKKCNEFTNMQALDVANLEKRLSLGNEILDKFTSIQQELKEKLEGAKETRLLYAVELSRWNKLYHIGEDGEEKSPPVHLDTDSEIRDFKKTDLLIDRTLYTKDGKNARGTISLRIQIPPDGLTDSQLDSTRKILEHMIIVGLSEHEDTPERRDQVAARYGFEGGFSEYLQKINQAVNDLPIKAESNKGEVVEWVWQKRIDKESAQDYKDIPGVWSQYTDPITKPFEPPKSLAELASFDPSALQPKDS